uniref:Uncharacterized protein n=1 Tax=Arundo donax TaxID=35708 RepID=A0A0A9A2A7_ARUDO
MFSLFTATLVCDYCRSVSCLSPVKLTTKQQLNNLQPLCQTTQGRPQDVSTAVVQRLGLLSVPRVIDETIHYFPVVSYGSLF